MVRHEVACVGWVASAGSAIVAVRLKTVGSSHRRRTSGVGKILWDESSVHSGNEVCPSLNIEGERTGRLRLRVIKREQPERSAMDFTTRAGDLLGGFDVTAQASWLIILLGLADTVDGVMVDTDRFFPAGLSLPTANDISLACSRRSPGAA
jgi:hypothetical protein